MVLGLGVHRGGLFEASDGMSRTPEVCNASKRMSDWLDKYYQESQRYPASAKGLSEKGIGAKKQVLIQPVYSEEALKGLIEKARSHFISSQETKRLRVLLTILPTCYLGGYFLLQFQHQFCTLFVAWFRTLPIGLKSYVILH